MKRGLWIPISFSILVLLLSIIHFSKDADFSWIHLAIHIPAIVGVISIFFAILLPLIRRNSIGKHLPLMINLHHFFSILGWTCILLHMIFLYVLIKKITIYIPSFATWDIALIKSGPIAVLLILVGGLGLFFKKRWKTFLTIHSINIIAFFWITIHGIVKDKAITGNLPYLIFLGTLDLILLLLIFVNYFQLKKSS